MCQFQPCMTETKASGFCTVCGKEICPDCAAAENAKRHASCIIGYGMHGPVPEDAPAPY